MKIIYNNKKERSAIMNYIDLRSDTVTQPTKAMRDAMYVAEVGDDVYHDDPTIIKLENLAASMLGKEAALFVPSGTMGNQICIMTHTKRGDEIITNANNHIIVHESGALAVLSQVNTHQIHNDTDMVYPQDVKNGYRPYDVHAPYTSLVCLENALSNGTVVPLSLMQETYKTAHDLKLKIHLDGARIFNAAVSLNVDVKAIAACADSVMFCVSKGLCAPVGSLICGDRVFIEQAKRNRKLLGGGMRQAGFLAASGLIALQEMTKRLAEDHRLARYLASELKQIDKIDLDISKVQINMVFFKINDDKFDHSLFYNYLYTNGIKINPIDNGYYRFVTHNDVDQTAIDKTIKLIKSYMKKDI